MVMEVTFSEGEGDKIEGKSYSSLPLSVRALRRNEPRSKGEKFHPVPASVHVRARDP